MQPEVRIRPKQEPEALSLRDLPKIIRIRETGRVYRLVRTRAGKVMLQAAEPE